MNSHDCQGISVEYMHNLKHIPVQSVKGFFYPRQWKCQVHTDAVLPMERTAVLPDYADIPSGLQQFIQRFSVIFAQFGKSETQYFQCFHGF